MSEGRSKNTVASEDIALYEVQVSSLGEVVKNIELDAIFHSWGWYQ